MFLSLSDFREILLEVAGRFPSKQALAEAIGITPPRFSKLLAGNYTLNVLNCLRLAKAAHLPPSKVLRATGSKEKIAIADLIEAMYGPGHAEVNEEDLKLLDRIRAIDDEDRGALMNMLRYFETKKRHAQPRTKRARTA